MTRDKRQGAFTLLEMLVALALMGVLASVLYGSLHIGFSARSRAEAATGPARAASFALEILRHDIECALPPTGVLAGAFLGLGGVGGGAGEAADSVVLYAPVEDLAVDGPVTRMIEFALVADPEEGDNILVRRTTANLLAPTMPEPREEILCRRVVLLDLSYFDGTSWQDEWDSSAHENALPLAIRVTIGVRNPDALTDEESVYRLARTIRIPCGAVPGGVGVSASSSR